MRSTEELTNERREAIQDRRARAPALHRTGAVGLSGAAQGGVGQGASGIDYTRLRWRYRASFQMREKSPLSL
jgi:hypothetical protein